ncbi:MAG: LysR family transcriptional regulator [Eubacteriales bacterium]|nr:LysR family transcriptional regulator [Eubacteriales bacterium]
MKLNQLKHFIEVVDCGSISAASDKLFLSQPNLSRSIHLLEEELGAKMLIRSVQGVEPTPFGRQVYYYAKSIREQVEMLERLKEVRDGGTVSSLKMSVSNLYLKDNLVLRFQEKIQADNLEICFHETAAEQALKEVAEGTSDFALLVLNDRQMPMFLKMTETHNLEAKVWDRSETYIHVHKDHELAGRDSVRTEDLADYVYIHPPHDFFANLNLLMHEEHITQQVSQKTITVTNYHAMLQILRYQGGYLVGNRWQIEELSNSSIESVRLEGGEVCQNFVFLCKGNGRQSALPDTAITFLNLVQDAYQLKDFSL